MANFAFLSPGENEHISQSRKNIQFSKLSVIARILIIAVISLGFMLSILAVWAETPTTHDWIVFASIATAALIQVEISRSVERARRRYRINVHITTNGLWFVAAALSVPAACAYLLATLLYLHGCFRVYADERLIRFDRALYNAAALGTSAMLLHLIAVGWTHGHHVAIGSFWTPLGIIAGLLAYDRFSLYYAQLGLLIRGEMPRRKFLIFGYPKDAYVAITSVCAGAILGVAVSANPIYVILMIPPVVVLHRSTLTRQIEQAAACDPKTGLPNSAAWNAAADKVAAQIDRGHLAHFAILMVDLDHFKNINDTYGHLAGDDVLIAVADVLRNEMRAEDLAGRFGGEEFVVLLPGSDADAARAAAERIRQRIESLTVRSEQNGEPVVVDSLSASIGVDIYSQGLVEDSLSRADKHMYAAKTAGRNRVCGPSRSTIATSGRQRVQS